MANTRIPAAALIVSLVVAWATPALADSIDSQVARRSATQAKRAEAAAKLDTLKANDNQLEDAVRQLDAAVANQSTTADAAQQAAGVARSAVGSAEAKLAATEQKMAGLRSQASALAIRAYIHPAGSALMEIVRARNLSEASTRETLLSHIASTDREVLGKLRAVREDQQAQQSNLARLREQAKTRLKAAADRLSQLKQALTDQGRLKTALDGRIQEFQGEVDGLAREEANIEGLIRSRQASGGSITGSPAPNAGPSPKGASASGLIWPLNGPITSPFGPRWGRMHTGIDIAGPYGAPIRAAKAGTVILAGSDGGYGNATIIDHGGGFSTLYGHQSRIAVSDGQTVSQGQIIGYEGCTGNCTGPHVHFETRVNGSPQNPMSYLP
jgi:murein DD-endopeptidase MepM/ murein hydrolase activator NlpD